jgi:diketogulonate reductase-like aldo/keto reductase
VSPHQVALAWLLARSQLILPIPGSGSPEHVEQNVAAASIDLDPAETRAITGPKQLPSLRMCGPPSLASMGTCLAQQDGEHDGSD